MCVTFLTNVPGPERFLHPPATRNQTVTEGNDVSTKSSDFGTISRFQLWGMGRLRGGLSESAPYAFHVRIAAVLRLNSPSLHRPECVQWSNRTEATDNRVFVRPWCADSGSWCSQLGLGCRLRATRCRTADRFCCSSEPPLNPKLEIRTER